MLVGLVVLLSVIGIVMVASATSGTSLAGLQQKQLAAVAFSFLCLIITAGFDYRRLADRAPVLFVVTTLLLAATLFLAPRIAGTKRWLQLGPLQLQPSEFAKIVVALMVAKLLAETRGSSLGLRDLTGPAVVTFLPALLIAAAPDLGTAVSLVPLLFAGSFLAGLRGRSIAIVCVIAALASATAWRFFLKDYQKARVYSFLDPDRDPRGAGYQKRQAQIAVGSGGMVGKGYLKGTQTQLGYLPARHTDFIFAVLAEEFGFMGVSLTLGLYMVLLWRCMEIARSARDRLGTFLVTCLTATLAFQVVYNVAMVAGLLPVKGLPLPLMSAGRSSVLATFLSLGLILSVRMRRFAN